MLWCGVWQSSDVVADKCVVLYLCAALVPLQENDMLQRQNELLRSSEAAYQREAQLVSGTWQQ